VAGSAFGCSPTCPPAPAASRLARSCSHLLGSSHSSRSARGPTPTARYHWAGRALVGFFSTLVGATGPLLAPFILALELSAPSTIATLAACQVFQHASKVLLFGVRGFDLGDYLWPCALLSVCAVVGSAIGTRLLDRLPEKAFRLTVKVVLTALALHQLYVGLHALLT
jgi:uncharacterized membrane protein YfcA